MARNFTVLWEAPMVSLPSTSFADRGIIPTTLQPCNAFDASADECIILSGILPAEYTGSGTLKLRALGCCSPTSGTLSFYATTEFHTPNANETENADDFGSNNTTGGSFTTEGTAYELEAFTLTLSSHGDSPVAGDHFRIKLFRDADGSIASDTMADDWLGQSYELFEEV